MAAVPMNDAPIGEVDIEVHRKYDIKRRIGKGAYGIVWHAVNKKTGQTVAVKKIFDAFRNQTDAQRTFREVMFLRQFGHHPNITSLLEVMRAKNDLDLYLILEYMDSDLHQVIRRENLLKDIHIRYIMYQLLRALQYLHSANVIHRDQKPSNILIDSDCRVRVADFGLARSLSQLDDDDQCDPTLTEYVATRWYRAPEILLADKSYTTGVDMWSVGCILGEMILGKPLFPGSSTLNQIERIMSAIRPPTWTEIISMCSGYAPSIVERASNRPKRPLMSMIPEASDDALDLLTKLLVFCPEKRLSAEQALLHPYVNRFHKAHLEHYSKFPNANVTNFPTLREESRLSVNQYREKLYQLIETTVYEPTEETNDLRATDVSDSEVEEENDSAKINNNLKESPNQKEPSMSRRNSDESHPVRRSNVSPFWRAHSQESSPTDKKSDCISNGTKIMEPVFRNSSTAPAAGLPSQHPRANTASAWLRFHQYSPSTIRTTQPTTTTYQRRPVSQDERKKTNCGRKQFGNFANASSLGAPKKIMLGYTQSHGTIAASALKQLKLSK